jgi:hypothetical protein
LRSKRTGSLRALRLRDGDDDSLRIGFFWVS